MSTQVVSVAVASGIKKREIPVSSSGLPKNAIFRKREFIISLVSLERDWLRETIISQQTKLCNHMSCIALSQPIATHCLADTPLRHRLAATEGSLLAILLIVRAFLQLPTNSLTLCLQKVNTCS